MTAKLTWTHDIPTVPGVYLRKNPRVQQIFKVEVFEILGKMCLSSPEFTAMRLENWTDASYMWWFGPIPQPAKIHDKSDYVIGLELPYP